MTGTMWAQELTSPGRFRLRDVPRPGANDLSDGDVLLRVLAGGICGSDLPFFRGARPKPADSSQVSTSARPLGWPAHEVVGEVVASRDASSGVGATVVGWADGQGGALSEYAIVRGEGVYEFRTPVPPERAVMLQPLACVINAVDQLGAVAGASVAVLGLGPIGLLFCHVLRHRGADHVVGVDRVWRHDVQETFGLSAHAHMSIDDWAMSLTDAERPGLVVEAIGHQVGTLADAVEAVAPGGHVLYFGIPDDLIYPFPMMKFLRKNARLSAGVTLARRASLAKADAYLSTYPELADVYVTDVHSMRDPQAAYELALHPAPGRLKITLMA